MMKRVLAGVILILLSGFILAKRLGTLEEISKPRFMVISNDKLYISEKTSIYIYSLKEMDLLKTFGKEGEGPNEFKISHGEAGIRINVNSDYLLVSSAAKLSYYNHAGDFIKEIKVPPLIHAIPAGRKFVSNGLHKSSGRFPNLAVYLWEEDFKSKEILLETDVAIGMGAKFIVPA